MALDYYVPSRRSSAITFDQEDIASIGEALTAAYLATTPTHGAEFPSTSRRRS
jgi:hypothetical protein